MSEVVLPEGWIETKLGAAIDYGKAAKKELSQVNRDTWILELEDIEKDSSKLIQRLLVADRPFKSTKNSFSKGDILYGKLRPYLNKVIIADTDGVCTTEIIPINGEPLINNRFLFYWLKSESFLSYVNAVSYGVNMPRLGTSDGLAAPFILPPLAEQKVIADKLDSLLAQVDNIKTRLDALPTIIKRFKQSVLSAAVSGRLTEDWREAKGLEWKWRELLLSDITSSVTYGYTASSTQNEVGPRMLRITDIQDGRVDWDNVPYCEIDEDRKDTYLLQKGDLVFARTGATVGKSFLIRDTPPDAVFASYLIRVRCNVGNSIEYLSYFFQSNNYWRQITEFSAGIGQPNVNGTKLKNLAIPLPPLEEQTEIVRRVEQLFAYADQIEQQVKNAQSRVNNLTQAILAKAFRGELTADWRAANPHLISGENSAQALLAKIKAERDKPKKTSKQQTMFNE